MKKVPTCKVLLDQNPYAGIIRIRFRAKTPGYHLSLRFMQAPHLRYKAITYLGYVVLF